MPQIAIVETLHVALVVSLRNKNQPTCCITRLQALAFPVTAKVPSLSSCYLLRALKLLNVIGITRPVQNSLDQHCQSLQSKSPTALLTWSGHGIRSIINDHDASQRSRTREATRTYSLLDTKSRPSGLPKRAWPCIDHSRDHRQHSPSSAFPHLHPFGFGTFAMDHLQRLRKLHSTRPWRNPTHFLRIPQNHVSSALCPFGPLYACHILRANLPDKGILSKSTLLAPETKWFSSKDRWHCSTASN